MLAAERVNRDGKGVSEWSRTGDKAQGFECIVGKIRRQMREYGIGRIWKLFVGGSDD